MFLIILLHYSLLNFLIYFYISFNYLILLMVLKKNFKSITVLLYFKKQFKITLSFIKLLDKNNIETIYIIETM